MQPDYFSWPLVQLDQITLKLENGISTAASQKVAKVKFAGRTLKDAKFVDEDQLVVALAEKRKFVIYRMA